MPAGPSAVETVEEAKGKRRLRVALRQARVDAKMTQKVAADELVWSTSKIVRIEQGTVPATPTDVRAMLHLYRVTDESRIEDLVDLAKNAREDKGWNAFSACVVGRAGAIVTSPLRRYLTSTNHPSSPACFRLRITHDPCCGHWATLRNK